MTDKTGRIGTSRRIVEKKPACRLASENAWRRLTAWLAISDSNFDVQSENSSLRTLSNVRIYLRQRGLS